MSLRFKGDVVLITGASSGLGAEMAYQFARDGASIALFARRKDRLDKLVAELATAGAKAMAIEGDVTEDGALEAAVQATLSRFGKLDIAIANAGFAVGGPFEKLTIEDYRRQFETNVFGVLRTAYASLDALKKSRGRLVIIGSVAGHVALPEGSPYAMSKFAVRALAESIGPELKASGVSVTLISPGVVQSEIWQVDNQGQFNGHRRSAVPKKLAVPTDSAVSEILEAVHRRQSERVVTGHGKVAVTVNRHLPKLFRVVASRL